MTRIDAFGSPRATLAARWLSTALFLAPGCSREPELPETQPAAPAPAPDRLAPEEHDPRSESAFGLPLPRALRVERDYGDTVFVVGELPFEETVRFVKERLVATHSELRAGRVVFPDAQLVGDLQKRNFDVEVWRDGAGTHLRLADKTRPAMVPGLTEAERWQRAGYGPNGKPLDPDVR